LEFTDMQKLGISLLSGLIFGFGLALAGMTNPQKVLGFLDITGKWDASLALVLAAAVGITAASFHWILRHSKPVFDTAFHMPKKTALDMPLVAGSILFGIGWGISGYCPGPAIALLAAPGRETLIFLPAMLAGWLLYAGIEKIRS
jgi:uncharacterized protein